MVRCWLFHLKSDTIKRSPNSFFASTCDPFLVRLRLGPHRMLEIVLLACNHQSSWIFHGNWKKKLTRNSDIYLNMLSRRNSVTVRAITVRVFSARSQKRQKETCFIIVIGSMCWVLLFTHSKRLIINIKSCRVTELLEKINNCAIFIL